MALGPSVALADPPGDTYGSRALHKDYTQNSVNGDFSPPKNVPAAAIPQSSPSQTDNAFQWGDAAAGAGVALLLSGTAVGTGIAVRRRGHGQPA
jgi:hypothetical protein